MLAKEDLGAPESQQVMRLRCPSRTTEIASNVWSRKPKVPTNLLGFPPFSIKHTQDNFGLHNVNWHPPKCKSAPSKKWHPPKSRKRAECGFGEYGFKHRAQWVFWPSPSSGQRTQWVSLSLAFVCQSELTEFLAELTEFAVKLSEAQSVLFSETVLSKQYSARFLKRDWRPPICSFCIELHRHLPSSIYILEGVNLHFGGWNCLGGAL